MRRTLAILGLSALVLPVKTYAGPLHRTSLFLGMDAGVLSLSSKNGTETGKSGVEGSLKIIASPEWDHWVLDLGAGYRYSQISSEPDSAGSRLKVITRSFSGEFSPRYKFDFAEVRGLQFGPVIQVLAGGDVSYDENGALDELASQYRAGGKLLCQWGEDFKWRAGASVLSSLNLNQRNALVVLFELQFGITPVRRALSPAPSAIAAASMPEFAEVRDRSIRIYLGEALLSFPLGSDRINSKVKEALASLVPVLLKNERKWSLIRVEGHTDSRDQNHQNQALSERRAKAVSAELSSLGIPTGRISSTGFGAEKPIDPGNNEEAFLLNRRVEIWIDEVDSGQIESIMTELRQMK